MDGVFWHLLLGRVIENMHLNLSTWIQSLHSWRNHIKLLVNLDFFYRLIMSPNVLLLDDRILDAHRVLHLKAHLTHLLVARINWVLFNSYKVFDELLFSIPLNTLNPVNFDGEKIRLLVEVDIVLFDEEVEEDLKDVWLEEGHDDKGTIFGQSSNSLVEIRLTLLDGLLAHIGSDSIECTLIDNAIESLILILPLKIGDISKFVAECQVLGLALLHLFDNSFLIIDTFDGQIF